MKLSIITVTWNSASHIIDQIQSVEAAANGIDYEHIIIDNGSHDETVAKIREHFPKMRIIGNKYNRGFAAANNIGYQASRGEYVLFLNPDTLLRSETLFSWIEHMDEMPKTVISGPRLISESGERNEEALPRRFPTFWNQLVVLTFLSRFFPGVVKRYRMADCSWDEEQVVDSVRGSCLLAKRWFLDELGYAFDPRFFIWFEDVDLCKEAYARGYEVRYMPQSTAVDLVGRSFAQRSSWWKRKRFFKSLLIYLWKWKFRG